MPINLDFKECSKDTRHSADHMHLHIPQNISVLMSYLNAPQCMKIWSWIQTVDKLETETGLENYNTGMYFQGTQPGSNYRDGPSGN